jgi:hypothetical protein
MVYRLLLRRDEPIPDCRGEFGLCPSILRTCHQVLSEARIILYSENTFSMTIFDKGGGKSGGKRAYFLKCDNFAGDARHEFGSRLEEMRRFNISVELQDESDFWNVKASVRDVCNVLSDVCVLDYLHITLDGRDVFEAQSLSRVLESFTLLRNVRSVELEGIPPVYSQYLTSKMTGCSPLCHLPKMYDALEFYAGPFNCCEKGLQEACNAMEDDDVDRFKDAREELITLVTKRMADARDHLFDHDGNWTRTMLGPLADIDGDGLGSRCSTC